MSVCYSIMCFDCKEELWCGQTTETFYSGEPHTMEALRVFLFKHKQHNLKFDAPEYYNSLGGWTEIDANDYKENITT